MAKLTKIPKEQLITMHNAVISGGYNFDACQLDAFFVLLTQFKKGNPLGTAYVVTCKDIEDITGRRWDYNQLKTAVNNLGELPFSINIRDLIIIRKKELDFALNQPIIDEMEVAKISIDVKEIEDVIKKQRKETYRRMFLFDSIQYTEGTGAFTVKLGDSVRPLLDNIKNNYTSIQLASLLKCQSKYAKRIYAYVRRWEGATPIKTITIYELKKMLGLWEMDKEGNDIKELYPSIADLRVNVLDVAKGQINDNTDVTFDYELVKTSRAITHVKMHLNIKKIATQVQIDFSESLDYQKNMKKLESYDLDHNLKDLIARSYFAEFTEMVNTMSERISRKELKIETTPMAYIKGAIAKKKWK